jgi:hypothetical protein
MWRIVPLVVVLVLAGCTELARPDLFHNNCYDSTQVVIDNKRTEEAYCWRILSRPYKVCSIGDTTWVHFRHMDRQECFWAPVPPRVP